MKCQTCSKEPPWNDFPAPDGWRVLGRGYPWESWHCEEHTPVEYQPKPIEEKPKEWHSCITGEGYDHDRQKALLGHTLSVVPELAGRDIVWPEKWTKPWGVRGLKAPTVESLNDPGRRREFMRQNPRFSEH